MLNLIIILGLLILSESINMQLFIFLAPLPLHVSAPCTHLILINVNLVQQDATIQDNFRVSHHVVCVCIIIKTRSTIVAQTDILIHQLHVEVGLRSFLILHLFVSCKTCACVHP
jgi:hypothetical protein